LRNFVLPLSDQDLERVLEREPRLLSSWTSHDDAATSGRSRAKSRDLIAFYREHASR